MCSSDLLNRETFHRVGMTPPPERWTFEEFESYGREYVRRANAGLSRQVNFLSSTAVYMPSTSTENSFIASAHVGLRLGKALFK